MKNNRMPIGYWGLTVACMLVARLAIGQAAGPPPIIGVALPQGQLGGSADVAEVLRTRVISQLQQQSVQAVPLPGAPGSSPDAEARAANAGYVLYVRMEQKHSMGSMFGKVASLARALPLGGLTGRGGAGELAGAAMQGAASAAASSAQSSMAGSQAAGSALAGVKSGDTVTLDYRLVAVGATTPTKAETFSTKAAGDGQDVIAPLVSQLTGAVVPLANGTTVEPAAPGSAAPPASAGTPPSSGHSSVFGGLFGKRTTPPPAAPAADSMDCAKLAAIGNGFMTVDTCEKFKGQQQAYTKAASDPSAVRAGDDQLTCAQITAELQQQQITAPDQTKVAAAQATAAQQMALLQKEQAEAMKRQAEDQAIVNAASAADRVTEAATMGVVRGRALETAEKGIDERHRVANERVINESRPIATKQYSQVADIGSDLTAQMQSNPRLARLLQLANSKRCKGMSSM